MSKTTTSVDIVVRLLTDIGRYFSHRSRTGRTTMPGAGSNNGGNYNNGGSTITETPITLATTIDSTTRTNTIPSKLNKHYEHTTPLFTTDITRSDTVDLINPLPGACTHYLHMLHLPQVRLPQHTVFDGTTPPFHEWMQETRNFLSITNYELMQQLDFALQSDQELTLDEVTATTEVGAARTTEIVGTDCTTDQQNYARS